ncbi:unnamed protein product [Didymodactylos carnosus]|uniref:Uncharacterized protein n=1 Tax=Didymodactylos carnosus TaxID=1234261 RepID=A0A814T859_9BILA|nr:unnamed protein product [Didymodactylos carnosus]CAF1157899.1 unnamed protein product [Didymodactylos carnosus]CAF3696985.1 unnamed protein product [Didymodactylos carnosus]CAF3921318.1 unnamed protein product [Didymodactylos carnosus]
MQSIDLNLIISNAHEDGCANIGLFNSSEVHRVILTNVFSIPKNRLVLISDTMGQRLGLNVHKTLPPHSFDSWIDNIIPSRGPYQTCENVYLSLDPITYKLKSIAYPVLVPDLPVDFVLGTLFFDELNIIWSSRLNRLITRREEEEDGEEEEEDREEEARRQTYRNIL